MPPLGVYRSSLPRTSAVFCADDAVCSSPNVTYSIPSGPNASAVAKLAAIVPPGGDCRLTPHEETTGACESVLEGDGLGVDDLVGFGVGVGVGVGVGEGVAIVCVVVGVPLAADFDEPP